MGVKLTLHFSASAHVHGTLGTMAAAELRAPLNTVHRLQLPLTFDFGGQDEWVPQKQLRRVIADSFPQAEVLV